MHTLLITRHAKSDWPAGVPDHDRPLAGRGRRDAPAVGRWLVGQGLCPDFAAVSSARRTQQTWQLLSGELDSRVDWSTESRLYAASWQAMLDVVRDLPEEAAVAGLIGHNPGCEDLAAALAGPHSDPDALRAMTMKYPTSGVAVLQLPGAWATAAVGSATLAAFAAPRG
jgi:phosphohistidine phosphatase